MARTRRESAERSYQENAETESETQPRVYEASLTDYKEATAKLRKRQSKQRFIDLQQVSKFAMI